MNAIDSRFKDQHTPRLKKFIKKVIYYMLFFRAHTILYNAADQYDIEYISSTKYLELFMIIIGTKYNTYQTDKNTDRQKIDWLIKYQFENEIFNSKEYIEIIKKYHDNELFWSHKIFFTTFAKDFY